MDEALLQTKLYIPISRPDLAARDGLVTRPRLIEQLDEGLQGKLTLISAPAGFGKTTLVSSWLENANLPAAWLSLDEDDNRPFLDLFHRCIADHSVRSWHRRAGRTASIAPAA